MLVGIDALDIERMRTLMDNSRFLTRYFTDYEIDYANQTVNKTMRLAGIYCAKEAFLKAINLGIGGGVDLKEVEVNHQKNGSPFLVLSDNAKKIINILNIKEIQISITHTHTTSTAICVCL